VHGVGPSSPRWRVLRLDEKRRQYPSTLGFHLAEWEEGFRHLVKAMVYVSRYTANTIDAQMGWDIDLLKMVSEEVGEIIKAENKSASPSF
jgi:hypothetical protein